MSFLKDYHYMCSETSKVFTDGLPKGARLTILAVRTGGYIVVGVAATILPLLAKK